ncbi:MAG: cadherin domain-containing protein [Panacagrimonas sp.]
MSLKVSVQEVAGARAAVEATPASPGGLPAARVAASGVGNTRKPGREESQDERRLTEEEAASIFLPNADVEVAAAESGGGDASPGASPATEAATPDGASGPSAYAKPAPGAQSSGGWFSEGFWIRAGGVALIGGIALATDDDDEDEDQSSNSAPAITSNGSGATATINVAENGTAVTQVTASDADADSLSYSLSGDDVALFQIDANTGTLTFRAAPNFEAPQDLDANNAYRLVVTVSDGRLSDTQTITVTVGNVDEPGNEPPFISSNGGGATATISVAENATTVTTVVASDVDAGSSVTYSISGGADASLFSINASTGALRFVNAPDFENPLDVGADKDYVVIVTASDGSLSDSQTLTVRVTNVDEAPVITSNQGGASAAISVVGGATAVTTVAATDQDAGATLVYSISGGVDSALFTIDASTGALRFLAAPVFDAPQDQGQNNVYNLVVAVSDGKSADTQSLAITVTDIAEPANQAPVISSNGGGESAALEVQEGATAVTMAMAADPDVEDTISYSLLESADSELFVIDEATGALSFVAAPDFEMPLDDDMNNVYAVMIVASDGALTDTQAINITVVDIAEPAPSSFEAAWDSSTLHSALVVDDPVLMQTDPSVTG